MSCKNVPIPAAAEAAGMTNLVFCEDFDNERSIDFSGEGRPGYSFYADRPYGGTTLTPEECQLRDSVLYFKPEECAAAIGLVTYSKKGRTGFTMHYGYAEARIRADLPASADYNGWPAFWGMEKADMMGEPWERCGELDILEMVDPKEKGRHGEVGKDVIYTGTLHEHWRTGEKRENGRPVTVFASSSVIASGYQDNFDYIDADWHTYAALWEPGYIAWYMDNKLMHAARFNATDIPEYYYRDDPKPVKRLGEVYPNLVERTWPGAHNVMETAEEILCLGCHKNWPMEVDWVRVWQK
ncbi:MAG: family 16 glycosylhydrolase [Clostridia bacterium]|nr:family 16 glycosylhydrolase [Clostridia bacterium]